MSHGFMFNRRTLLAGSSAAGLVGMLAACGGNKGGGASNAESASALGVGEDIAKLVSVNPKERSELKEGGELKLPLNQIGPDFNMASQNGNSSYTAQLISAISPITTTGLWVSDYEGTWTPNKDFCESFQEELSDGVQTLKIKLNPKAKFNDGTAIDIKALQATTEILRDGLDNGFNIVDAGPHAFIKSVEEDGDPYTVKVTMTQPYYPIADVFGSGVFHPAVNDKKVFNDGFVDKVHPEWQAGPFKLQEWNSSEKTATIVPNENWWGEKPLLERVTFRQMEASAQRAAFKNGEIDAVEARTLTAYKDVEGQDGTEVRRGQRLFAGGLNMSSFRLPVEMRKAIFAAVDRSALAKVRFNGLNWNEQMPGSMMLMPFSEYYKDNFSEATKGWDAGKILEDAGYKKDGDFYKKGGKNAKFAVTTFGDDPVDAALAQTLVQQMKDKGIECTIDNQPDANFGTVLGNKDFDLTFSGYTVGSDATVASRQYYHSANNDGEGSKDIDKLIDEAASMQDNKERNAKCNEIEKKHMAEFAMMGTLFNGPEIYVAKTGLANYGAGLFGAQRYNPQMWSNIGWVKE
ncbi:MAG: ABC transporter family substrate-binding protein [Rothia sp. (in: high G+C Gram-positive bacteria)]|nr:ABC transporter family substrate-binding protein [Rothia sp. (in: high G+C Gram-positive bacteria)]